MRLQTQHILEMGREEFETATKTCPCSHSFYVGEGEQFCQEVEDEVEDSADALFGDGPQDQGTVKAKRNFFMGWDLKAKRAIEAGEIIGGAR